MSGFPRQLARTRRFSLGVPRGFVAGVSSSGPVVLFLRTDAGDDALTHLWRHDPREGTTRKLVDVRHLGDSGSMPPAERARRERAREQADGVVAYDVDDAMSMVAFALGGRLHSVELSTGRVVHHPTAAPVFDPRPAPDGRSIAYHAADGLHLLDLGGAGGPGRERPLISEPGVSWGRAEFIAAEEMGRGRGWWWSGDGTAIAVARVDESAVEGWTIADPADPTAPAATLRYPAAGTRNAEVTLWVLDVRSGERIEIIWDRVQDEYLAHVSWGDGPLTLLVQSRDQRRARVLVADPVTGTTTLVRGWSDPAWVEPVPGIPMWVHGRLVTVEDRWSSGDDTRAVCVDGEVVTPDGLQVRELLGLATDPGPGAAANGRAPEAGVVFLASPVDDPTRIDTYHLDVDAPPGAGVRSMTGSLPAGLHRRVVGRPRASGTDALCAVPWVELSSTLERASPLVVAAWPADRDVARAAGTRATDDPVTVLRRELEVVAEVPVVRARPRMLELGPRRLRAALLLPREEDVRALGRLPVLLDPYGGPHAQRVLATEAAYLTSQWLADQGFAVLVVDGRGSPGRGPRWERAVAGDLATVVLQDQVDALHAAARLEPRLDLGRVGIRGWSFGGYLAALAVLRRPDVFRAAVAGAPVTDWRLYDTHYTERYLGHPEREPGAYAVSSLIDAEGGLSGAAPWAEDRAPGLLLIHGLADDNVVAAHSLRLSAALLAEGRAHSFLPLSGVTHMTPQEVVAERLLERQVSFLREHLTT